LAYTDIFSIKAKADSDTKAKAKKALEIERDYLEELWSKLRRYIEDLTECYWKTY
jgi:hypothetical protein